MTRLEGQEMREGLASGREDDAVKGEEQGRRNPLGRNGGGAVKTEAKDRIIGEGKGEGVVGVGVNDAMVAEGEGGRIIREEENGGRLGGGSSEEKLGRDAREENRGEVLGRRIRERA